MINEQYIEREPKKCFEILRECLIYFSENYPDELRMATLIGKSGVLPIRDFEKFKEGSEKYKDFKEILKESIGTDDIREAQISFEKEEQEYFKPETFVEDFFKWKDQCERCGQKKLEKGNDEVKKWLIISIKVLGLKRMNELFNQEINSLKPSVWHFLWGVVKPERIKKLREKSNQFKREVPNF